MSELTELDKEKAVLGLVALFILPIAILVEAFVMQKAYLLFLASNTGIPALTFANFVGISCFWTVCAIACVRKNDLKPKKTSEEINETMKYLMWKSFVLPLGIFVVIELMYFILRGLGKL